MAGEATTPAAGATEGQQAQQNQPQAAAQIQQNQQQGQSAQGEGGKGGEKTYTQAELDRIVRERIEQTKSPAQQQAQTPPPSGTDSALQAQIAAMQQALVHSEIKAQMAISGVSSEKVGRACRLVDATACAGKDGAPDAAKIKTEIEAVLKDWPELKAAAAVSPGFKIGADGGGQDKSTGNTDEISRIFGNLK